MPPARAVEIGLGVRGALKSAHKAGVMHRDVKPGNVLVEAGPRLRVKITHFGRARTADDASITQSGAVLGTPL